MSTTDGGLEFERVARPYEFTEGLLWDGEAALFSDMPMKQIFRLDIAIGETNVVYSDTGASNGP